MSEKLVKACQEGKIEVVRQLLTNTKLDVNEFWKGVSY